MKHRRPRGAAFALLAALALTLVATPARSAAIEDVYAALPGNLGDAVTVDAFYTNPGDAKIVSDYEAFLDDEVMPEHSVILLDGPPAPPEAWEGGWVSVTGRVDTLEVDYHPNPLDPQPIILRDISYVVLRKAPGTPGLQQGLLDPHEDGYGARADCDSCKFAILISGGVDARNNHARYWNNIKMLYKLKTDSLGYCPENIKTLYYKGDSEDTAVIPHARVDSCTVDKIRQAHRDIAAKVAECKRNGKTSELQLLVTNHGSANGDIDMLGWVDALKPDSLKSWIQTVIDSCLSELNVEMVQCYGGAPANTLKNLDDKKKTTMNVSSAAGDSVLHISKGGSTGYAVYLKVKVDSLKAGVDYEDAVRAGMAAYDSFLAADSTLHCRRGKSVHWRSYPMKEYCKWHKVEVPVGGQVHLEFSGDSSSCGNVTVYEEQPDSTKTKVAVWNWNVPGSSGHQAGNERRVINADSTSTGRFWIHNDDPFSNTCFRLKVISEQTRSLAESPTNLTAMAGHSHGGNDDSADEFGYLTGTEVFVADVDQPGMNLCQLPRAIGQNGVETLMVSYTNGGAPGCENMVLRLDVASVLQPGLLVIDAESEYGMIPVDIHEPGTYEIPLGPVFGNFLAFNPPWTYDRTTSASFEFDCWGIAIADNETGVVENSPATRAVRVFPSYPNPFNPVSNFAFEIPRADYVRVEVFDLNGRKVRTIVNEYTLPGRHEVAWDGRDEAGLKVSSGVYFWRLKAGEDTRSSKMVLIK
ncbi:MAG: FlgD immunoglobulin-like domain containing protein [Gemmatimonadota bacterium]|jgi:hypothetical protein|nr:FlgD immunoglobulin-like domain containing protein [Gemmatimonadota bacterium]